MSALGAGTRARGVSLAAVFLLPVVLLAPALRRGRVLSSADMALDWHLFWSARPQGYTGPRNGLIGDPVMQFMPWRRFASDELRAGRLPFWNPHAFAGSPLLGNSQSAVFDPLSLPYLLVREPVRASVWVALLRLWVAGLGAWLLARRLGLSAGGAALAGVTYSCGGFMVVWLLFPHASSAAWFPFALLAAEAIAAGRLARGVGGLAATLAAAILGGHVEVAFYSGLAAGLYTLARRAQLAGWRPRSLIASGGAVAAAGLLALAIAAVHVLPFFGALSQGTLAGSRVQLSRSVRPSWGVPIARLALQAFPYLYGRPLLGEVSFSSARTNFCEHSGTYVSLLGAILAVLGAATARRGSPARSLAMVGGLAWLYSAWFGPLVAIAARLPVFNVLPPGRVSFVALLAGALLAGFGLDRLRTPLSGRARRALTISALALIAGAVVALAALWWTSGGAPGWRIVAAALARAPTRALFVGDEHLLAAAFPRAATVFARAFLAPWGLIAFLSACFLLSGARLGRAAVPGAVAVAACDLLAFGHGFNPAVPVAWTYPHTAALDELHRVAGDGRVLVLDWGLPANLATYYGLDDVVGYDAIGRARIERLLTLAGPFQPGPAQFRLGLFDRYDSPVIDLLGVRAIAATRALETPRLRLAARVGRTYVYENVRAFQRAFVPAKVVLVRDLDAAYRVAATSSPDPAETALVEAPTASGLAAGSGRVAWRRLSPDHLEVAATMDRPGVVVVSEAYDPGWRARVDGRDQAVYPCDLALMAVEVPAGSHTVVLRYRPPSWPLALTLSGAGVLVAIAGLVSGRRHTDPPPKEVSSRGAQRSQSLPRATARGGICFLRFSEQPPADPSPSRRSGSG